MSSRFSAVSSDEEPSADEPQLASMDADKRTAAIPVRDRVLNKRGIRTSEQSLSVKFLTFVDLSLAICQDPREAADVTATRTQIAIIEDARGLGAFIGDDLLVAYTILQEITQSRSIAASFRPIRNQLQP